jgi:hypothetical protein
MYANDEVEKAVTNPNIVTVDFSILAIEPVKIVANTRVYNTRVKQQPSSRNIGTARALR